MNLTQLLNIKWAVFDLVSKIKSKQILADLTICMWVLSPRTSAGVCLESWKAIFQPVLQFCKHRSVCQRTQTRVWYILFPVVAHSGRKLPVMIVHSEITWWPITFLSLDLQPSFSVQMLHFWFFFYFTTWSIWCDTLNLTLALVLTGTSHFSLLSFLFFSHFSKQLRMPMTNIFANRHTDECIDG